jgi:hypothetical protein
MLRNAIASVALLVPACLALASTDCKSTVATITIETGEKDKSGYAVELSSGVTFAVKAGSANRQEILGMSQLAMTFGAAITARFAADGVRCDAKARRTDLIALIRGGEETTTITKAPPSGSSTATTVVITPDPASAPRKTK